MAPNIRGPGKSSGPKKFTYETPDDAITFGEMCQVDKSLPMGHRACRFPFGEKGNWSYCGKPSVELQYWCPEHYFLVYQQLKPKSKGRPFILPGGKK